MIERMLDESGVRILLEPFGLQLSSDQIGQILVYLNLLMRWNTKINLTSIRNAEEAVMRHFGESLCLAGWVNLQGNLLDIGSGAGFPGLALQIVFPGLTTILLEPVAKKRAFLREVVRACDFRPVEVRRERLEEFAGSYQGKRFNAITARAVGHFDQIVPEAVKILKSDGRLYLWVSQQQGNDLRQSSDKVEWDSPFTIPLGREREIWVGRRK